MTVHPGLHNLYSTGSGATIAFLVIARTAGLVACFVAARLLDRLARREVLRLWLRPARVVRVARMVLLSPDSIRSPSGF